MNTMIVKPDRQGCVIAKAGEIIRKGGLVAFPTETVYGLGGDGLNPAASAKIYEAKGRPSDNPLILHIAERKAVYDFTSQVPPVAEKLMDAFWPGPLTIIFPKAEKVPSATTGGLNTVAIRYPDHPIALAMIQAAGVPVAAPSANTSGRPSPTRADHVAEDMNGRIDMILDGGEVGIGVESTIVDVTQPVPMILRPGYITKEMLEQVIGPVETDAAVTHSVGANVHPKAPGMKYRHYAPKAPLTIVEGPQDAVADKIGKLAALAFAEGKRCGIIATEETKDCYHQGLVIAIGSRKREESVAHNLYAVLRDLDEAKVDVIYSEGFSHDHLGMAIMNRLVKAAGHQVIHAEMSEKN